MSDRIDILEKRILELEKRVSVLEEKEPEAEIQSVSLVSSKEPIQPVLQKAVVPTPPPMMPTPPPMTSGNPLPVTPKAAAEFYAKPQTAHHKEGFETFVGKNLMGILASILVFIGLILFAIVLVPHLTDEIKMAGMYGLSFALAGVSLYQLRRKKENALLLSLSGCGFGAVFISLFVTYTYFHAIHMVVLYLLLILWAAASLYLSNRFSWLFQVIGEAGVYISCVTGMSHIITSEEKALLPSLMVFFLIGSGIFFFAGKKDQKGRLITNVFEAVNMSTMSMMLYEYFTATPYSRAGWLDTKGLPAYVVLVFLVFIVALLTAQIHRFAMEQKELELLFGLLYYGNLIYVLYQSYDVSLWMDGVWIALGVLLYGVLTAVTDRTFICKEIWRGASVGMILLALIDIDSTNDVTILAILLFVAVSVLFLGYGYWKKDRFTRISGLIFYGSGVMISLSGFYGRTWQDAIIAATYLIFMYAIGLGVYLWMKNHKDDYHIAAKITVHLALILTILIGLDDVLPLENDARLLIEWTCIAAMNVAVAKTTFANNWKTGKREPIFWWTTYVINAIAFSVGLEFIADMHIKDWARLVAIVITLVLCSVNTPEQMKGRSLLFKHQLISEFFVSAKYCFVLVFVLTQLGVMNYISDIVVLVFAFGCIALGFLFRKKGMRIFGLGLSIIIMVKLILIDIYYDSSIARAGSFLLCGVLCFGISALYTYVDKKMQNEKIPEKGNVQS